MANADGSVIFSCDLDSTKAQKKLSKLRDEISSAMISCSTVWNE